MKKLLFTMAVLCLTVLFTHAQNIHTLTIKNVTSNDIYVIINGNTIGGVPCAPDYRSAIIAIPPGVVDYIDPTYVTGGVNNSGGTALGANGVFNTVNVFTANPNSGCSGMKMYQAGLCNGNTSFNNVPFFHYNPTATTVCQYIGSYTIKTTQTGSSSMEIAIY
ncbi:MAG: hypothetical protein R2800_08275 [Flavipsychrobacter sp.]